MVELICVGALLMDILGSTQKLPQKNEEVFVDGFRLLPGGSAANTAVAAARLGLETGFVGGVGDDEFGRMLVRDLAKHGVGTGAVKALQVPTGTCVVVTDEDGTRHMYASTAAALNFSPADINESYLASAKIVHLADMPSTVMLEAAARYARGLVSINPGNLTVGLGYERVKSLLSSADIYISSLEEASKLYGTDDLDKIVEGLLGEGIKTIAITLGNEGSLVADKNQRLKIPAFKVKAIDTTGAGDAFSAGFLYGMIKDLPLEECGKWGSAAAALCVSREGARLNSTKLEIGKLIRG